MGGGGHKRSFIREGLCHASNSTGWSVFRRDLKRAFGVGAKFQRGVVAANGGVDCPRKLCSGCSETPKIAEGR